MDQSEISRYVGSMQQLAYVRPFVYQEGRSTGLKAFEVKNGKLMFHVLSDKCLDVTDCTFKGMNINFLSKPGLQGRNHYDTNGAEAQHSIMGGLFFTSGLENICAPCTVDGKDYPMHGRIRTTPGEHLSADAAWVKGEYRLSVSGEMREAELFGENMVLRRRIESVYGEPSILVTDEITNETYAKQPLMILYHINMGYPFLNEKTRLYIPSAKITPRDEITAKHVGSFDRMDRPKDNEPEYVYLHELKKNRGENHMILVVNREENTGLKLEFSKKYLPHFMEWKSTASGDYVIGFEPANSLAYGRPYHEKEHTMHYLEPFRSEKNVLKFTFLDGKKEIAGAVGEYEKLYNTVKNTQEEK